MLAIEGQIINHERIFRGRVEIDPATGLIIEVGEPTGKAEMILDDELIFPGFIDLHVHAREDISHKEDYKEDFISASSAAINGGVVAFAEMPNNPVPPIDEESYDAKRRLAQKSAVEVVLYVGIKKGAHPLKSKVPYKAYMGKSVGALFFNGKDDLDRALKDYSGQAVSFHCEDPEVLAENKNQPTHELRRPAQAEISAIDFVIAMIEKYKLRGKICHLSTKAGLRKIIEAKRSGLDITCEVAPHHLYFDPPSPLVPAPAGTINTGSSKFLQTNPPIRSKEDRLALIAGLKSGEIDYLASDHAPHTVQEKTQGASGLPHLDTYGIFTTWLMAECGFTPQDIARICAYNPGLFLSRFLDVKYGEIKAGFAGSLTVIDMNRPTTVSRSKLKSKCGWSPFEGREFPGNVVYTIIKGRLYKN